MGKIHQRLPCERASLRELIVIRDILISLSEAHIAQSVMRAFQGHSTGSLSFPHFIISDLIILPFFQEHIFRYHHFKLILSSLDDDK